MAIAVRKKKTTATDEILAPETVAPVTSTPPAVPVQDMAAPVTGTATAAPIPNADKPNAFDKVLTQANDGVTMGAELPVVKSALQTATDQVLTAPTTQEDHRYTGPETRSTETATAASAGPGPSTPPETAPVTQEEWETDPIFESDPVSVGYVEKTLDNPLTGGTFSYKEYSPPAYLDPESKAAWEQTNANIQEFLAAVTNPNTLSEGGFFNRIKQMLEGTDANESGFLVTIKQHLELGNVQDLVIPVIEKMQQKQRRLIKTTPPPGSQSTPPPVREGETNVPESGTGGTPGQGAVGDTGTGGIGTGGIDAGTPPETQTKPFEEGELSKTPQQELDEFLRTDPTQHPDGLAGWIQERDRLRKAAKETEVPQGDPNAKTTITEDDKISGETYADSFLKDLIDKGFTLSPEEAETIRREIEGATQKALSGLSARGLGRGSEAAGVIAQGEFETVRQIGEAKARVRKEGTEAALKASQMFEDRLNSDRNYQIATSGQNLEALKNAQDVSFRDRAQQLKEMETGAAIDLMEREFGLKIDELEWKKFIETGELNAKIFDIEGTQRLQEIKIVNDYWLAKSDLELQERLGLSKLDLDRWMAGEQVDLDKASIAITRMFKEMELEIEEAKIRAALAAAGTDEFDLVMSFLSLGASTALALA